MFATFENSATLKRGVRHSYPRLLRVTLPYLHLLTDKAKTRFSALLGHINCSIGVWPAILFDTLKVRCVISI